MGQADLRAVQRLRRQRLPPPDGWPVPSDRLTFDTFVDDAAAVLDHLGDRDDVGPLAVLGHSKGGTVAVHLADGRDDLVTLLLVATPNVPLPDLLRTQAETLADLVADTGGGSAAEAAVEGLHELADEVASIVDGATEGPPVQGASRAYWDSWADAAGSAPQLVERSSLPILALGGAHDWNAPPEQVVAWDEHLPRTAGSTSSPTSRTS